MLVFVAALIASLTATQFDNLFTPAYFKLLDLIILPRTLLAIFAGGALACIGSCFQVIFRNPLASPYTTGLSSVAALSLALSELLIIFFAFKSNIGLILYITSSLAFVFTMYLMLKRKMSKQSLLLVGVSVGILSSSFIVLAQSFMGNESVARLVRWTMGNIDIIGYQGVLILGSASIFFLFFIYTQRTRITLFSISEEFAHTRGVNVEGLFQRTFIGANFFLIILIWFCGPIGFIGLIVPHFTKKIFGADFSKNIFPNFILGASLLMIATVLSKVLISTHVIPVGAVTASIGAPFLIYLLVRSRF